MSLFLLHGAIKFQVLDAAVFKEVAHNCEQLGELTKD